MKIGRKIIQNRKIEIYSQTEFIAVYKGKKIKIIGNIGLDKFFRPVSNGMIRFKLIVSDVKKGWLHMQEFPEFKNIDEAIKYVLSKCNCFILN